MSVRNLFSKYVKNTNYKEDILVSYHFVCIPKVEILKVIQTETHHGQIFISTRSLKHVYDRHIFDKKAFSDFYFILKNFEEMISTPDRIYKNHEGKRGDYIFVKIIKEKFYMFTIEIIENARIETVSASVTGEKYLSKFTLLWSWGTANPPS